MTSAVIRRAQPGDLPTLAALRWEFRTDGAPPVEERAAFEPRFRKEVAAALADGTWLAWVAEVDGLVVGHVYGARIAKLPNPVDEAETHLYISNLYVRPEHRGRGLAKDLLDAVLADGDEVDATILWARPGTEGLYRRYGFTASPEIMERR
ncbi:GNAT family N-acetyltransferase [Pseudonocardia aurantiaca]|uniref:GNAT family N-acetyltransferase n=1 Tax=Pseudonocardia aurantiaca TaxID=75290 RepID=A0ABW4FEY6_9PSEU